jgi:octaprenyl-diphosphate synthase
MMEETAEVSDFLEVSDLFSRRIDECRVNVDNAISSEIRLFKDSPFFELLTYALTGGKRLRPILLLLAFQSVGGSEKDPFPAAVAIELIHSCSLVIDDIIDEDLTRRDVAAFHSSYGLKISLLNAEMLVSIMLDMTARCSDPRVTHALAQAVSSLGIGTFEELAVYRRKQPIGIREYIRILKKKTASIFEASAKMGALLAGAQENEINALCDYGRLLGLAYQIQDDLADREDDLSRDLSSYLRGKSKDEFYLRELSTSYIAEAKQRLQELKSSEAKSLLFKLADTIAKRPLTGP